MKFIFLFQIFFIQIYAITTTFTFNNSLSSILQSSSSCSCDYVNNCCDEFCCCDSMCNITITTTWDTSKKCKDKKYSNPISIPECNRDYQKSSSDLYLGLRIAYNLFKNLGCVVSSQNQIQDENIGIDSNSYTSTISSYTTQYSTLSTYQSLTSSNFIPSTLITSQTIMQLYRPKSDSDESCYSTQAIIYQTYPISICKRELTSAEMTSLSSTEFKYSSYTSGTLFGKSLTITATYMISYSSDSTKYQYTLLTTTPTDATGISNLVVGAIYQVIMPEVTSNTTTPTGTSPNSINATLFLIDSAVVNSNSRYVIPQIYGIIYTSTTGEIYDISSKGGYLRGSPLRFKNSIDSTNQEFLQSMFLGTEPYNGNCILNTINDISQGFEIKFLQNMKISCYKNSSSTVGFSNSQLYNGIANNLKYVARYGDSGSNDLTTDEWLAISACTTTSNIYQFALQIYYEVFGEKGKERFRINQAQYSCSIISQVDNPSTELRFYVQFYEIENSWIKFKGGNPQLVGGLPDDVLAPFIYYS